MKFNYKDKSQIPENNIPENNFQDTNEVENTNTSNSNNEVQLDMPSFEDFMNDSTSTPFLDFSNTKETDDISKNIFEPNISFDDAPVDVYEPEKETSLPNDVISHDSSDFDINPIFAPIPDDIKNDRTGLDIEVPDIPEVENKKEKDFSETNYEPDFDINPLFSPIPDDVKNDKVELDVEIPDIPEVKDKKETDLSETDYEPDFSLNPLFSPIPNDLKDEKDSNISTNKTSDNENSPETFSDTEKDQVKTEEDIFSLNEVFDAEEIKKEKKSLFGNKKEKTKKEKVEKTPKEKKSLFGKKNKKSEMLDKLDEIAQTETEMDNIAPDLLSSYGLIDKKETNINQEEDFTTEALEDFPKQESTNNEIPSVLLENELGPFSSPTETKIETKEENTSPISSFPEINEQSSQYSNTENTVFSPQTDVDNNTLDIGVDADILDTTKKKKKINPLLIIIIAIVLLAIILSVMLVTKLFGGSEPVNHIPETTPITQENQETVELDNETVNSLVEETQEIVNNANDVANTYEENNELPPQVGIDIDEEIQTENIEETPTTKVFTNKEITFTYPSEWTEISSFNVRETSDNVTNVVMLGETPLDVEDTNNMRITVEKTLTSITAKDYLAKTEELMKTSFTNIKARKSAELTIAGREAPSRIYTFNDESGNSIEQFQIYVANAQDIYVITFTSSEENFAKNLDTYKEILKTIQIN